MKDNERKQPLRIVPLTVSLLIPLAVGGLSSFMTAGDMKVYATFNRPPLAPPGWVFPVVWTVLYVLMGIASYLILISGADPEEKKKALLFYIAQLVMNLFWSTLFFTYSLYLIALIWLAAMWVLILICTVRFFRIRRAAGLMMGALLLWSTFAAYLNLAWYLMSMTPMPVL